MNRCWKIGYREGNFDDQNRIFLLEDKNKIWQVQTALVSWHLCGCQRHYSGACFGLNDGWSLAGSFWYCASPFLVLLPRFQLQWLASAPAGFGVCEETKWTTTTTTTTLSLIPCWSGASPVEKAMVLAVAPDLPRSSHSSLSCLGDLCRSLHGTWRCRPVWCRTPLHRELKWHRLGRNVCIRLISMEILWRVL